LSVRSKPKIGLALSGGAARGFSYIGVLKVFEKHKIPIDYISGTSAGAIIGSLYASGYSAKEIGEIITSTPWSSIFDISDFRSGLIGQKKINKYLKKLLKGKQFKDLNIPLAVTAVDIGNGSEVVFDSGDVANAVNASMSIPGIFAPVKIKNRYYIDGGVVDPCPVGILNRKKIDIKIAVDLSIETKGYKFSKAAPEEKSNPAFDKMLVNGLNNFKNFLKGKHYLPSAILWWINPKKILQILHSPAPPIIEITSRAYYLQQNELTKSKLIEHKPDIIIRPNIDKIGMFDFHKYKSAVKAGEYATRRHISKIKKLAKIK
jgi:NTE family protein